MLPHQTEEQILHCIDANQPDAALDQMTSEIQVNYIATDGDTLLHKAVRKGYAALASRLLLLDVDFHIKNVKGELALSEEFAGTATLHAIRQTYHRDTLAPRSLDNLSGEVRTVVEKLQQDGIVKVEGMLQGEQLRQIQKDVAAIVRGLQFKKLFGKAKYIHYDQREYWQHNHHSYVFNDPLRKSPELVKFCETPFITEAASAYLGEKCHIKRVMGMHYLPSPPLAKQQFGWHHDMEDRQCKIMVLLTDIGPDDQYMAYIPGTHNVSHGYERFLTNKLTFEEYNLDPEKVTEIHTLGKAGDVYFFDSNGMHKGTRSNGRTRDALFIEYTTEKNWKSIWGTDMNESLRQHIRNGSNALLKEFITVPPKWNRAKETNERKLPTWAESLNKPELWV